MTKPRRIPGSDAMDELVQAIGEDAARDLARRFGGTSLYVPRSIGEHHPIAVAIGADNAARLSNWSGGSALSIPKQPEKRQRVLDLRARALTVTEIARETDYSERHVYRLLRQRERDRQPGFFDED